MSKKSEAANRQAAAALAAEAETRQALFEWDQRMDRQAELDRQHRDQILAEARNQRALDKLEAEAVELENYRQQIVAQAASSKSVAPQLLNFIAGSSKPEIDASLEQARQATAEIAAEVAGQV
jgi:hypothetical protein